MNGLVPYNEFYNTGTRDIIIINEQSSRKSFVAAATILRVHFIERETFEWCKEGAH